ncbi:MAG: hypothetical protein Q8S32_17460 [Burkholderiaceae bacterium]|nr:hypothetical protein [Burkholderiaceae bacterium]
MTRQLALCRPPHPQKIFCARRLAQKEGRGVRNNPWIISPFYPKPLILEKSGSTGCTSFSTGRPPFSTGRTRFSTGVVFLPTAFLSLFLFNKQKEEEEKRAIQRKRASTGVHRCLFFNPRVSTPFHGFSVETRGLFLLPEQWVTWLGTAIHGST